MNENNDGRGDLEPPQVAVFGNLHDYLASNPDLMSRVSNRQPGLADVECCDICERQLDDPNRTGSGNCGGTCLECMASAGDPDCIESLAAETSFKPPAPRD